MSSYLLFAVIGLGSGAVYAVLAQGLVMMHRASNIINFAHGALALYAIYAYVGLRSEGWLILPIPGAAAIDLGEPVSFAVGLLLAVAMTAALGALAYLLVFRLLQHATILAKIIATVGLLLTISSLLLVHFPSESGRPLSVRQILPSDMILVAGRNIPSDRLWLTGLALASSVILAAIYRFSSFGLSTRACASSPKGAVLTGHNPERVALMNWTLASALAGIFGVLAAPLLTISPTSVVLLVVPALAAALVARFSSFMLACLTGLGLGMAEGILVSLQGQYTWLPQQGLQTAAPLLLIIGIAYFRGHTTVRRDDLEQDRLPRSPRPENVVRNAALWAVVGAGALFVAGGNIRLGLIVSLIGGIVCLSWVVITGYVGQVSLLQVTFAGLSGLLLSALATRAGVPFPIGPLLAAAIVAGLGVVVSLPALRVRGTSLAVVTLAAAVAIEQLVFSNSALTGGIEGNPVAAPTVVGVELGILGPGYPRVEFALFVLLVALAVAMGVANLRRSPSGLRMLAVRMNERAAAADGVNVARVKVFGFAIASFIAGLAGPLYAYQQVRLSASYFSVLTTLVFLAWAYLGGITSVRGAFVGGLLLPGGLVITLIEEVVYLGQYQSLIAGILLMASAVLHPDGIVGLVDELRNGRSARRTDAYTGGRASNGGLRPAVPLGSSVRVAGDRRSGS